MSDMTPVHSAEYGTADENKELFAKLDQQREQGKLAEARELAPEGYEPPKLETIFEEKPEEELKKLTKEKLLEYMKEWSEAQDQIAAAKAEYAAKLAEQAAIHGIPRGKVGEPIQAMLENRPDHPGRRVPYPLMDEDGSPRVSKRRKKPITRTDN